MGKYDRVNTSYEKNYRNKKQTKEKQEDLKKKFMNYILSKEEHIYISAKDASKDLNTSRKKIISMIPHFENKKLISVYTRTSHRGCVYNNGRICFSVTILNYKLNLLKEDNTNRTQCLDDITQYIIKNIHRHRRGVNIYSMIDEVVEYDLINENDVEYIMETLCTFDFEPDSIVEYLNDEQFNKYFNVIKNNGQKLQYILTFESHRLSSKQFLFILRDAIDKNNEYIIGEYLSLKNLVKTEIDIYMKYILKTRNIELAECFCERIKNVKTNKTSYDKINSLLIMNKLNIGSE